MAKMLKTNEQKEAERAERAKAKAKREAAERLAAEELRARRQHQLEIATHAITVVEQRGRDVRNLENRREQLHDHANGFYEEIDKLAKGKALLEVTDLILEEANQIIRDAKAIVDGDPYLSRVKEFVPAGNNPVYPDVVVSLRSVLQALERHEPSLESRREEIEGKLREAITIHTALELYLEEGALPNRDQTSASLPDGATLAKVWFVGTYGSARFDDTRLDAFEDLEAYLEAQG